MANILTEIAALNDIVTFAEANRMWGFKRGLVKTHYARGKYDPRRIKDCGGCKLISKSYMTEIYGEAKFEENEITDRC